MPFQKLTIPIVYPIKFGLHDTVRHQKGGHYEICGLPDELVIEETGEPAYAYRGPDQRVWIRAQSKMEDGRFELIKTANYIKLEKRQKQQRFDNIILGTILFLIGVFWWCSKH